MSSMNWQQLLSASRLGRPESQTPTAATRTDFMRDYDRIIFSSAFRRMQDKTQVFPLAKSDYVRTRLTHSLEVASVGRSLGMLVADVIAKHQPEVATIANPYDLGSIVATACLAHDIGNPPFGHTGESAIQEWFETYTKLDELTAVEQADLLKFEGNAQGFRTLSRLQYAPQPGGLQLTYAVLGTFTKYPRASSVDSQQNNGVSGKKFGFMQSEAELFKDVAEKLGLVPKSGKGAAWCRHPLAFLVEAADDICYHVIDIEDGYKTGCVSLEEITALHEPWLSSEAWQRGLTIQNHNRRVEYFRACTVDAMIRSAITVFDANYAGLLNGTYDDELTSGITLRTEFEAFKRLAKQKVYCARPVVEIEACGFEVIAGLLDAFLDALDCKAEKRATGRIRSEVLLELMPELPNDLSNLSRYERILLATDFISGMTDSFAVTLYQRIRGIALP